ncbi:site-specific integrase [Candidatus Enterococcus murrayae]|uniref:Tyrosine-type recombinase/integrase n=1 Tax=Candidatus Enterococcus murrayae TaxID=2815321 RepID=A0ABS3HNZ8_9ENTE|nr:site-specific integrase [Enterococcus sp. MJM16]MBO0455063.1 tyrosine-type recombinase/integrase [Enterococcus sp. MJM16]
MSTNIKKYTKKDGSSAYMFRKYLGLDPVTGRQIEKTRRGFKTLKEAKLELSKLEIDYQENGPSQQFKSRSYKEVCEEWFEIVYKMKVKESTFWNTRMIFDKHILPELGNLRINKITVTFCQKIANCWSRKSPKRYSRFINYAGMIFDYALSIGELNVNPMAKILTPIVQLDEEEHKKFYERDQLIDFLSDMKLQFPEIRYVFFSLLAYTGMRKGEALALHWNDIDFEMKFLKINKTLAVGKKGKLLIQKPKTKAANRKITLDDHTLSLLQKWHISQQRELDQLKIHKRQDQLVFSKYDNLPMYPRTPQSWLESFYIKNPDMFRISPHGFRHTHASLLFEAGATMKQVQSRLGHTNIKTTMNVYTHVTKSAEEETALLFADFMSNGKSLV